jgi:acetyl esterase/lipase
VRLVECVFILAISVSLSSAQRSPQWAVDASIDYWIQPDITYNVANNYQDKLDVIYPHSPPMKVPAVIYFHGGGWVSGSKEEVTIQLLPYLQMGWAAVNVEYRMASVSKAPAAVEDCRCALRWVVQNAKLYHIDTAKLVLSGQSAGGHLALMTGMVTEATGFDDNCPDEGPEPRVAAIVNWFGITDVVDLLSGPDRRTFAVMWLGSALARRSTARRVSPLAYVRSGLPPIITIHGDADPLVPYSQAVRLHDALDKAHDPNRLVSIHGGGHGNFTIQDNRKAFAAIVKFLAKYGLTSVGGHDPGAVGYK